MFDQDDLFSARARSDDPDTSHDAARSVTDLRPKQAAVLEVLRCYRYGLTDEDMLRAYEDLVDSDLAPRQSVSGLRTRRKELVDLGLVVDSGERAPMSTGRMAIVWKVAA